MVKFTTNDLIETCHSGDETDFEELALSDQFDYDFMLIYAIRHNFINGCEMLVNRFGAIPHKKHWYVLCRYGSDEMFVRFSKRFTPKYTYVYKGIGAECNTKLFQYLSENIEYHRKSVIEYALTNARKYDHIDLISQIMKYMCDNGDSKSI